MLTYRGAAGCQHPAMLPCAGTTVWLLAPVRGGVCSGSPACVLAGELALAGWL